MRSRQGIGDTNYDLVVPGISGAKVGTLGEARPREKPEPHPRDSPLTFAKVLIVDDEVLIRRIFPRMFKAEPYVFFTAANGNEALALFAEHQPIDLLITDLQLTSTMGGYELANRLVQLQPSLHVIVISGNVDSEDGSDPGPYRTLGKPFSADAVRTLLREVLGIID